MQEISAKLSQTANRLERLTQPYFKLVRFSAVYLNYYFNFRTHLNLLI